MLNDMSLYFRLHMSNFKQVNCQTLGQKRENYGPKLYRKETHLHYGGGKTQKSLD